MASGGKGKPRIRRSDESTRERHAVRVAERQNLADVESQAVELAYQDVCAPRMRTLVNDLGGPRQIERRTGLNHSTVSSWIAESRATPPNLKMLIQMLVDTDESIDYLAGFSGSPRRRSDRTNIGDLRKELRSYVVGALARELRSNPAFVSDVLPGVDEILDSVVEQYRVTVQTELAEKRQWDFDRALARNRSARPTPRVPRRIGDAIADELWRTRRRWTTAETMRLRARPSPEP